ncbi:MAG: hypothetical protein R6W75_08130 [Smithellaceae bacterium]
MKLSIQFAEALFELLEIHQLPYSRFPQKPLLNTLDDDGIVLITGRSQKTVSLRSPESLLNYLDNHFGISDLRAYISTLSDQTATRADLARVATDTKIQRKKVFQGFLVNCYDDIYGELYEKSTLLKPVAGSFIFINEFENFTLEPDVTIVVVENFENFKYIEQQKVLFAHIERPLFVSRYWSISLGEWLARIANAYVHFGDFDLSGLKIYIQEFRNKRASHLNTSFLIPSNIEVLLEKHGNRETYLKQLDDTRYIDFAQYPEISNLAEIINHHQKSLHQEFFIKSQKS